MTIETFLLSLTKSEIKDLIFAVNRFGSRGQGLVADESNVRFFRKAYVESCIEKAINSDKLNAAGVFYMEKLQYRLEQI